MTIYYDDATDNQLTRTGTGRYSMTIRGWYGGGLTASTDTEAIKLFKIILNNYNF